MMTEDMSLNTTSTSPMSTPTSHSSICPDCKGTGWIYYEDENGYEMGRICPCGIREREIKASRLRFANVPECFKDVRIKETSPKYYKTDEAKKPFIESCKSIRKWLDDIDNMIEAGKGLYIFSKAKGSGKTRMAAAIANDLLEKGKSVKFTTSLQILQEIKKTWGKEASEESKLLKDLSNTEILIIDDFGAENVKDWANEIFYSIINERYLNRKVTIFTSNYDLADQKYNNRINDRINGMCFKIVFPNESVRSNMAENSDNNFFVPK